MIVSLDTVSKNFKLFNANGNQWATRQLLKDFVDHWKIIFVEKNHLKTGNKIGLGFPLTDIYYFGALIAAAELGLKLVVLDISNQSVLPSDKNSQTQSFFPIDLFLSGKMLTTEKHKYYSSKSIQTEYWDVWDSYQTKSSGWWDLSERSKIDPAAGLLLCTSSGTTGQPKKIEHNHSFLYNISRRNKELFRFKGNVLHIRNLHHGSSLATYFLPALMSDDCTGHYAFNYELPETKNLVQYCVDHNINHIQFPYVNMLEHFLKQAVSQKKIFKELTLYTLSYISPAWQPLINECGVSKIVSIFGCNETSGPLFTNTLLPDQTEFDYRTFVTTDDFYEFKFNSQNQLLVKLNDYDKTITVQDSFIQKGNKFIHIGRNDLVRINDVPVDLFWILELAKNENISGQLVVDRDREKLYLAVWDDSDLQSATYLLNNKLSYKYGNQIRIDFSKHLIESDYMLGIKLDHESLRNVFRGVV
jgi:hypothetical protein